MPIPFGTFSNVVGGSVVTFCLSDYVDEVNGGIGCRRYTSASNHAGMYKTSIESRRNYLVWLKTLLATITVL